MEIKFAPGFQNSMDKLFHWKYAPYRAWQAFLDIPRVIKWKWQRMNRGWSDQDVWEAHYHISNVISGMLKHLADNAHSYPLTNGIDTPEKWAAKLRELADKIAAYNLMSNMPEGWTQDQENAAYKITQDALRELADFYGNLWD